MCGSDNATDAKRCVTCGASLAGAMLANGSVGQAGNICPRCKNEVALGVKFCPNCGNKIE